MVFSPLSSGLFLENVETQTDVQNVQNVYNVYYVYYVPFIAALCYQSVKHDAVGRRTSEKIKCFEVCSFCHCCRCFRIRIIHSGVECFAAAAERWDVIRFLIDMQMKRPTRSSGCGLNSSWPAGSPPPSTHSCEGTGADPSSTQNAALPCRYIMFLMEITACRVKEGSAVVEKRHAKLWKSEKTVRLYSRRGQTPGPVQAERLLFSSEFHLSLTSEKMCGIKQLMF